MNYRTCTQCLLCGKPTGLVLSLGKTPLANELLAEPQTPELFPLNLVQCRRCNHLQIDTLVDEKRLYQHYLYVSDTGPSNRKHFQDYASELTKRFSPTTVVDIGSNDGLFLSFFKDSGCDVLGVDPAVNIAEMANEKGIPTLAEFFSEGLAEQIVKEAGQADLVTCNNCFAHNADLSTIVRGIRKLLKPDGVFVFEVSYAMDLLKKNLFDLVYHEHIHHWHLRAAKRFFARFGLDVFDAERIDTHGGSIRVFVKHSTSKAHTFSLRLAMMLKEEANIRELARRFAAHVNDLKIELTHYCKEIRSRKKRISILGYPAKAATLTYFFQLQGMIDNVFDDNPLKIGHWTHQGKQIMSTKEISKNKPDYLLVLAWNYADQLIKANSNFRGRFIVPLPKIRIV